MVWEVPFVRRRVLIVDDNVDHAAALVQLLAMMGHEAEAVASGGAAIAAARRFRPDVVLLDLNLPDADGVEVCRSLRREAGLSGARILVITGSGSIEDERRVYESGCDQFLRKPVDPQFLTSLLGKQSPARSSSD